MIKKIVKKHKEKIFKFVSSSLIIGASTYLLGIFFIDFLGFAYWIFGAFATPYSLILRYIAGEKLVWKKKELEIEKELEEKAKYDMDRLRFRKSEMGF